MNLPSSITPEAAAWMQAQMSIAAARAAAPLRQDIDRADQWMNGLFIVLLNVLPYLLREHPALAQQLEPQWRQAADRFDQLRDGAAMEDDDESPEVLEPRKMLYRIFELLGAWQRAQAGQWGRRRSA